MSPLARTGIFALVRTDATMRPIDEATQEDWDFCSEKALELFEFGQKKAAENGMILVDTKYEMGKDENGNILLIDEIPKIRKDVGYVPLVTPSSQIVGAQALMNVLDDQRYKTLNKEFIDMVNGKYGKIPGDICPKLKKKIDKASKNIDIYEDVQNLEFYKNEFKKFCLDNQIKKISKKLQVNY